MLPSVLQNCRYEVKQPPMQGIISAGEYDCRVADSRKEMPDIAIALTEIVSSHFRCGLRI
jgi:hypothetical protein